MNQWVITICNRILFGMGLCDMCEAKILFFFFFMFPTYTSSYTYFSINPSYIYPRPSPPFRKKTSRGQLCWMGVRSGGLNQISDASSDQSCEDDYLCNIFLLLIKKRKLNECNHINLI